MTDIDDEINKGNNLQSGKIKSLEAKLAIKEK